MKHGMAIIWAVAALSMVLLATGCASYYKVTDPQSGKMYYAQEVDRMSGGAVRLKDARSGSIVTLQNSEVKEISSKEYEAGLAGPASTPAPAAAPAPAPSSAPSGTK